MLRQWWTQQILNLYSIVSSEVYFTRLAGSKASLHQISFPAPVKLFDKDGKTGGLELRITTQVKLVLETDGMSVLVLLFNYLIVIKAFAWMQHLHWDFHS